jgi:hypothetical protein
MSSIANPVGAAPKRFVLIFGDQPWSRDRIIQESINAGLEVVLARLSSDHSETILPKVHREKGAPEEPGSAALRSEVLPDQVSRLSEEMLVRLRQQYGEDWCALPLNDYVTEYAAAVSVHHSCYPARSAEIVKRKHELRNLWNELAREERESFCPVEYCYVELRNDTGPADCHPGSGFDALPEDTPLMVKPDELSSSIEIHRAHSKQEAMRVAREICTQLRSKWYQVGRSIGTEVRPRVVIEKAIERSQALHPGAEYSIEFVSFEGRHFAAGVVQKWIGQNFIECGHLFPAESFPTYLTPALERAIGTLLQQLGVRYGVSHWEFIVTRTNRIALVEGHLRPAGDRIMELIEQSTGRSPTAALCEAFSLKATNFSFNPAISTGIFWMVPESPLEKVTSVNIDRSVTDVLCRDLYVNNEGLSQAAHWSHATDWMTRFAHVMATGADWQQVHDRCRRVAQSISLSGMNGGVPGSTGLMLAIDQPLATPLHTVANAG